MAALLVLVAATAGGAAFLLLEERSGRRRALRRIDSFSAAPAAPRKPVRVPPLVARLAEVSRRLSRRRSERDLAALLAAAGLSGRISVDGLLALELLAGAGLGAAGGLLGSSAGAAAAVLLACVAGGAGALLPRLLLRLRARRRSAEICAELAGALDLLAVSVRAGLGLEAAMARYAESSQTALAEELRLVLAASRVGAGRRESLEMMASRVRGREVSTFVRAIVQGEQLGSSLGETLRAQAAESRRRRRVAAEERANKASVKMIFPTALFIFPALFVVVLVPAILSVAQAL